MPNISSQENEARDEQESTKRKERANRILDAAAELTIRLGYAKTTIDDIAKQAGVAKGTIYLHWKTRDELFTALLQREQVAAAKEIQQRMTADPEGGSLHGMTRHWGYAVMNSQLLKALFLRDADILGELVRLKQNTVDTEHFMEEFEVYIDVLRKNGLVRTDISLKEFMYMFSAITTGFLMIDQFLPEDYKLSDEQVVELMSETVRCTFEPASTDTATPASLQEASTVFQHLLAEVQEEDQKEVE